MANIDSSITVVVSIVVVAILCRLSVMPTFRNVNWELCYLGLGGHKTRRTRTHTVEWFKYRCIVVGVSVECVRLRTNAHCFIVCVCARMYYCVGVCM